jgi:hypothetical protein
MWSSYAAIARPGSGKGTLEFYALGDPDIVFGGRPVNSVGFANSAGPCLNQTTGNFDKGSKTFVFSIKLCNDGYCKDNEDDTCKYIYLNPCLLINN